MFDYQRVLGLKEICQIFFLMAVFLYDSFDREELVLLAQLHLVWLDVLQSSESSMFLPKNPQFFVPAQPIPTRTNQNMHRKLHGLSHGHMPGWLRNRRETPHPLKHVVYYQLGSSFHFTGSENQSNPKNKSHHVYVICTVYRYGRCSAFRQD